MSKLFLSYLVCFMSGAFFAQAKLNLESASEITAWVTTHQFKTDESLGYTLAVETVNQQPVLVFSHNTGNRKEFTNLTYSTGATSAMVTASGAGNNTIDVMVLENGNLMLAGMVFTTEE
ncbi:MAG: hypothetical protein FJZ80_00380 [Bacteroidetes bacterium]|nr:hypothetical protein [Bacteroidota bacterium]MBM3423891.1 hypothetical protein [Bacteroidota bacterium]